MKLIELKWLDFMGLRGAGSAPIADGVTRIIGRNGAGKSAILNAIRWGLGGDGFLEELPVRRGTDGTEVEVVADGFIVKRTISANGRRSCEVTVDGKPQARPQSFLDRLKGSLAFRPLGFLDLKPAEQAAELAKLTGIDVADFARRRKVAYDERTDVAREMKAMETRLAATPPVDAPDDLVQIGELLERAKAGRAANANIDAIARQLAYAEAEAKRTEQEIADAELQLSTLRNRLASQATLIEESGQRLELAKPTSVDVSAIEAQVESAEEINAKVRAKQARTKLADEVSMAQKRHADAEAKIQAIDDERDAVFAAAKIPVPGLTFDTETVRLDGLPLRQVNAAQRLRTVVAIGLAANPELPVMLVEEGPLLDAEGMAIVEAMAREAGAQLVVERLPNDDETGVRIVDGRVVEEAMAGA